MNTWQKYNTAWNRGTWSQTTVSDFQSEMTGTTSVLGRDKSVQVTFNGDKAYAKDGVVNFPNLDPTMRLDYNKKALFRGWVDHESAKVRFSDKKFMSTKDELIEKHPLLHDVFSTIEGVRVERDYLDLYEGSAKNLGELSSKTAEMAITLHERAIKEDGKSAIEIAEELKISSTEDLDKKAKETAALAPYKNPNSILPSAIGAFARDDFEGVYNYSTIKQLEEYVNKEKMLEWVEAINKLETTEQSFSLAQQIIEELEEEEPEGQGDGDGEGEGESDSEGEGEGDGDGEDKSSGDKGADHKPTEFSDVIEDSTDMGEYQFRKDKGNVPYRVLTTEFDTNLHWSDGKWDESVSAYIKTKEGINSDIATMKRKIELLIQATRKIDWDTLKEDGKFDSRRMVGAYNAEPNVFKTRDDASDLDTAIGILIDMSGSMNEDIWDKKLVETVKIEDPYTGETRSKRRADAAFETAILLSECLDKIGVPFSITGFDAEFIRSGHSKIMNKLGKSSMDDWGRVSPLRTHQFKRFQDRMFDARKYMHHIGQLRPVAGQCNSDAESVFNEAGKLRQRPEKRKIMFVISDGQPSCYGNQRSQEKKLKTVIEDISSYIDVVGIGIETDCVKDFYPKHVILKNGAELPEVALKLLKDALIYEKK